MHKLNRILNRDDVAVEVGVDIFDERREGGGLAGTSRSGDQHKPRAHVTKLFDHGGNVEVFEGCNFCRDQTKHGSEAIFLLEVVAAEAGFFIHRISEVEVAGFEVIFVSFRVANFAQQCLDQVVGKEFGVLDDADGTVDSDFREFAFAEVEVGASGLDEVL